MTLAMAPAFAGHGNWPVFVPNGGQVHDGQGGARPEVTHVLRQPGMNVLLRSTGFSYQVQQLRPAEADDGTYQLHYHRIDVELVGARLPVVEEGRPLHRHTYEVAGHPSTTVDAVDEVHYLDIVEGVDLIFRSGPAGFKYDIRCRDAAALQRVRFRYTGSLRPLEKLPDGQVMLYTALGALHEKLPTSFFLTPQGEQHASVAAVVDARSGEVSFALQGEWPEGAPLVIDPMPDVVWSTYLGGEGYDLITQVAVDEEGGTFVTGYTDSAGNIATAGAFQGALQGFQNCFLMKYAPDGTKLYGTYFGGQQVDRCYGMVRDGGTGDIYVSGSSFSEGVATPGTHQTTLGSVDDGLLVRFTAQGQLVWATYYGGNDHDFIASLAMDPAGNVVMTGHTRSSVGIATDGSLLPGGENCFAARFDPQGQLLWGTYLGGVYDQGWGVGVDPLGHVYVCGVTGSSTGIATAGAQQPVYGGALDAFLVKYGPDGELLWGTYHGGTGRDIANALVVCADGTVAMVGDTESPAGMALPGAYQPAPASVDDGFMARFTAEGALVQATYLGGPEVDYLKAVVEQVDGGLLIAGQSQSAAGLTTANAFQPTPAGEYDALLIRLSPQATLDMGTYLGGPLTDLANDVAMDPTTGHALLVGMTRSASGVATPGAHDTVWAGGIFDGFLARLCMPPPVSIVPAGGLLSCDEGPLFFGLDQALANMLWSNGATTPTMELLPPGPGAVLVHALGTDAAGCTLFSDTLTAVFAPAFTPDLSIVADAPLPACLGDVLGLSLSTTVPAQSWWNGSTAPATTLVLQDTAATWYTVTVFDDLGCAYTDSILVWADICKGVRELPGVAGLRVHPNPGQGLLHVHWPAHAGGTLRFEVFAMDGRSLHQAMVQEGAGVPTNWPAGPCVLRLGPENGDERAVVRYLLLPGAAP